METYALKAAKRTVLGKRAKQLRVDNILPAVLYGPNVKTQPIQLDARSFQRIFDATGESSLIDLTVDEDEPMKVLVHDTSRDPLTGHITHVDFYQVDMSKKITTDVELSFTGEPPAVKEAGGVLVTPIDSIEVECLPKALVHEITVPLDGLRTFKDSVTVKDLVVPEGITIMHAPEDVVALVKPPRSDKEMEELEQEVSEDVADVEKIEGEKKEGEEEGEEGAPVSDEAPAPGDDDTKKES